MDFITSSASFHLPILSFGLGVIEIECIIVVEVGLKCDQREREIRSRGR